MPSSNGGEYTVAHLSPLCSGCAPSPMLVLHRQIEVRRLCAVAMAVFDAFIVLCSQLDIRLDSDKHRAMLRTVTDSVRTERDRFTQFMFDRGRLATETEDLPPIDPLEVYRWQIRLRRHSSVWNAAIAQLYAVFFPVKPPSKSICTQLDTWLLEQQQLAQLITDRLNGEQNEDQSPTNDDVSSSFPVSDTTSQSIDQSSNESNSYLPHSEPPACELLTPIPNSYDIKSIPITDSLASTMEFETDYSLDPSVDEPSNDEPNNDDLSITVTKQPLPNLSSTMPAQSLLHVAASSPAPSPLIRPSIISIPPPIPRAVTRSPSLSSMLTPSHFTSTQPGNPPPQVFIETIFPALSAWPTSCVDFLREDNHRAMPVLPWALPLVVCEDEPGSIVAYALASFEHLLHVGRLRQCDLELLKEASIECDRRQQPAYILPADRIRSTKTTKRSTPLQIVTQLSGISITSTPNTGSSTDITPLSANQSIKQSVNRSSNQVTNQSSNQEISQPTKSDLPRQNTVPVVPLHPAISLPPSMSFNTSQITGMAAEPPEDFTIDALYKAKRQSQQSIEAQLTNETDVTPFTVSWQDVPQTINQSINQSAFSSIINAMTPEDRISFSVTCYFPKQFHALRSFYSAGDHEIIVSLCQCSKWQATGGKSGSAFTKSKDERFVFKFVRKPELQTFLDFALSYFAYMAKSAFHGLPSLLVPVLGAFQITAKRSRGDRIPSLYALLMPNLFCEGATRLHFDLKGSTTNRYVPPSMRQSSPSPSMKPETETNGQSNNNQSVNSSTNPLSARSPHPQSPTLKSSQSTNQPTALRVLLDDNLMELTDQNGLPLCETSREMLRMGIFNDSLFLASQECVDYSLLLGIDPVKHYAVTGLIDYVRQYRSAERIETSIKSLTVALPTVIPPQQYKARFRQAMDRYFRLQTSDIDVEQNENENMDDLMSPRSIDGSSDQYLQTSRSLDTSRADDDQWTELDDFTNHEPHKLHLEQLFESPSFSRRVHSASSPSPLS